MVSNCPVKIEAKGQDTRDLSDEEAIVWRQSFGKSAAQLNTFHNMDNDGISRLKTEIQLS
jgi:hypothetical protein